MNKLEVDVRQVTQMFAELSGKQQRQSYRNALRRAAGILQKETKKQLRLVIGKAINHKNKWNGKSLGSGIKVKADKEGKEAKVHILGDFRLKFFELGTKQRKLRKSGANRGRIKASYFFKTAKANKEKEIFSQMDSLISQSIQRIADKKRK